MIDKFIEVDQRKIYTKYGKHVMWYVIVPDDFDEDKEQFEVTKSMQKFPIWCSDSQDILYFTSDGMLFLMCSYYGCDYPRFLEETSCNFRWRYAHNRIEIKWLKQWYHDENSEWSPMYKFISQAYRNWKMDNEIEKQIVKQCQCSID